jgi:hypothetical protein
MASVMATRRTWTDDQLREAVASSTSFTMVQERLGLRGGSHYIVQRRALELGLDTRHFTRAARGSSWPDDAVREAIATSTTWTAALFKLGVQPGGGGYQKLRRRVRELGLDTGHFQRSSTRWTDDQLCTAVARSQSYASVLRLLGLVPAGGNYDQVCRRIRELGLDTSHFTGQGWRRGCAIAPRPARPLDEVLVANRWTTTHNLKQRLIRLGLKHARCELCGWAERAADGRIPIELDHINGDKMDNRLENLRVLCPNCHALQPTHRGLNRRSRRK